MLIFLLGARTSELCNTSQNKIAQDAHRNCMSNLLCIVQAKHRTCLDNHNIYSCYYVDIIVMKQAGSRSRTLDLLDRRLCRESMLKGQSRYPRL